MESTHPLQLCHWNTQLQTEASQYRIRTHCVRLKNARTLCKRETIPRLRWESRWQRLTVNLGHALLLSSSLCPGSIPNIDKPWITPSNRKTTLIWEFLSDPAALKSYKRSRNCFWRAQLHLSVPQCGLSSTRKKVTLCSVNVKLSVVK